MPVTADEGALDESKKTVFSRFYLFESKLELQLELREEYNNFMPIQEVTDFPSQTTTHLVIASLKLTVL